MPFVLKPSWMGRRISVRRAVGRDPEGRLRFADTVGDLVALDDSVAVVEGRAGRVEIPLATVVAARLVAASTADELALQAVAAKNLRAAEVEELGGWLLRADAGFTRRANSVLPLRQAGMPVPEALQRAQDWYAARGLDALVQVPLESRRLLDAELGERGWSAEAHTHLMVARLDMLRRVEPVAQVTLDSAPDDAWLRAYRDGDGLSEHGRALLRRHDMARFASVRIDGEVVAVGRGAVDDGWLGVMAVAVDQAHRRQGLAAAVMAALWQWGGEAGATRSYVQVIADNEPAARLYERLGYFVHHEYHYRREPTTGP